MSRLDDLLREWVGRFGWLDSFIPLWATYAWLALGLALVGGALIIGRWRERAALLTALAGAAGAAIILSATLQAGELGGDVQARHLMPALVAVPLVAGEIVSRSRLRAQVGRVVVAVFAATAALQWVGWYWNARRHATGSDGTALVHSGLGMGTAAWMAVLVRRRAVRCRADARLGAPAGP